MKESAQQKCQFSNWLKKIQRELTLRNLNSQTVTFNHVNSHLLDKQSSVSPSNQKKWIQMKNKYGSCLDDILQGKPKGRSLN